MPEKTLREDRAANAGIGRLDGNERGELKAIFENVPPRFILVHRPSFGHSAAWRGRGVL
jgi:hypothetical protein